MPRSRDWPAEAPRTRLQVTAGLAGLEAARQAWQRLAAGRAVGERTAYRVELVLEELLMNVALHGLPGPAAPLVTLTLVLADDAVGVQIEDEGPPFDPHAAPPAQAADADAGGRGLLLVRRSVRRWQHTREGGRNVQRLEIARD